MSNTVTLTQTIMLKNDVLGARINLTRLTNIGHTEKGHIQPVSFGPIFEGCLAGVHGKQELQDLVDEMPMAIGEEYDLPVWEKVPACYEGEYTLEQLNNYKVVDLILRDLN